MERVAAVTIDRRHIAYCFKHLARVRVVNDRIGGRAVVIFWIPGVASALDAASISEGRSVGSSGVFFRQLGGRSLTFDRAGGDRFVDRETGSVWTGLGQAIDGPLRGSRLEPIAHGDYFWFAWAAFRPTTELRP
jgi:hypothetical protein